MNSHRRRDFLGNTLGEAARLGEVAWLGEVARGPTNINLSTFCIGIASFGLGPSGNIGLSTFWIGIASCGLGPGGNISLSTFWIGIASFGLGATIIDLSTFWSGIASFGLGTTIIDIGIGTFWSRRSDIATDSLSLFHMKFDLTPDFSTSGHWPFRIC